MAGTPEGQASCSGAPEVVGCFSDRESFSAAVAELKQAGFRHSDLSVLDTHESISASGRPSEVWKESLAGLVGEVKYVGPLTAAVRQGDHQGHLLPGQAELRLDRRKLGLVAQSRVEAVECLIEGFFGAPP